MYKLGTIYIINNLADCDIYYRPKIVIMSLRLILPFTLPLNYFQCLLLAHMQVGG